MNRTKLTVGFWHQVGHIPATRAIIVDAAHGLSTGDIILIDGDDATPSIDGVHTVERVSANAFAINVTVTVNGTKTAELKDDPGRLAGYIAVQLHGGQDMHILFKAIEIIGEPLEEKK